MLREGLPQGDGVENISTEMKDGTVPESEGVETPLNYEFVFDKVKELGNIRDPQSCARSIIWRRFYDLVRNNIVTYDELFHEAVVGMYMAVESGKPVESDDVFRSIGRQLCKYKYDVIDREYKSIPFSELANNNDDISGEELTDKLRFKIKLEQVSDDTQEAVIGDDFITDLVRQSRQVIMENGESIRNGQGQRDWEVFVRYLSGDRVEDICASCPWLTSKSSVEGALNRIILVLRKNIADAAGANVAVNIMSEGRRTRNVQQDSRFDPKEYYREWYERNKEERQKAMREYKRRKRAEEKGSTVLGGQEIEGNGGGTT